MKRAFLTLALAIVALSGAAKLSDEEISTFGGCYFAPMTSASLWRMRDQDGAIREFERTGAGLASVGGWTAQMNGDEVTVLAPAKDGLPALKYNFRNGRLDSLDVEGRHCRFGYPNPLVYEGEDICPLWPDVEETTYEQLAANAPQWGDGSRLRLWFASPNQAGAFLCFLLAVFVTLACYGRRWYWIALGMAGSLAVSVMILKTDSRGALLSALAVVASVALCRLHRRFELTWKRVLLAAGGCLVIAAVGITCYLLVSSRSASGFSGSDQTRKEILTAVPAMLHDASSGWGDWSGAGKAYTEWYQPISDMRQRFNLISDHVTMIVAHGWAGGGCYILLWLVGMFILWTFAWRGGSPIPVAVWLALGISAAFNVVMFARYVLWLPVASLAILLFDRRWLSRDFWLRPLVSAFVCAGLAVGVLYAVCATVPRAVIPMRHADGRSIINGEEAATWLVAEKEVLGMVTVSRDIRRFYEKVPQAPSIGYVEDLADLPEKGIGRLVLSGESGSSFLLTFRQRCLPIALPREIVFLAPDFPPSDIPVELRAKARVAYVIGEFAARYHPEFADPPKWCIQVPGAEVYIPGWMRFCVN